MKLTYLSSICVLNKVRMKVTAFARSYSDAPAAKGNVAFYVLLLASFFSMQVLWEALSVTES